MAQDIDRGARRPDRRHRSAQQIGAAEKSCHEPRRRPLVQVLRGADLGDPALVHHGDAVGDRHCLLLVVGDIDRRDRKFLLQPDDLAAHLDPQLRVEVRERLVEQQHAWPDRDCACQRHPLLLAAGQFVDHAVAHAVQSDLLQAGLHAAFDLRRTLALDPQAIGDVFEHRQMRKQRIVLEHEADVALIGGKAGDVLAAEQDPPR